VGQRNRRKGNTMGTPTPVILSVKTPTYSEVVIEASDGKRYFADLAPFKQVYCFPKTLEAWQQVAVDSQGLGLVWTSRFEVHVDQILGLASREEPAARAS